MQPQGNEDERCYSISQAQMYKKFSLLLQIPAKQPIAPQL